MKTQARQFKRSTLLLAFAAAFVFSVAASLALIFSAGAESEDDSDPDLETYSAYKFVTIYEGQEKITIRTNAKTVGDALGVAGYTLEDGDESEPATSEKINASPYFINIYRAEPVIIQDGLTSRYLLTASFDPKTIYNSAGIVVYDEDTFTVSLTKNFLESGLCRSYQILRNGSRRITVEEEIPYEETTIKDYDLEVGTYEVRTLGEVGRKRLTYDVTYENNTEVSRTLVSEETIAEPVARVVAYGASEIEMNPLTAAMGRNRYTTKNLSGTTVERQETYYDLPMRGVMASCGKSTTTIASFDLNGHTHTLTNTGANYYIRDDGVKTDEDGYILVAANLSRYPRCSVVETSLGAGKVYDTGTFATTNPEQFDIATDWTNHNGN